MSLKLQQIQAAFARKREQEQNRVERSAAVNRYYDHWGKVTTRFENWTAPEYYKKAEDQLKHTQEKKVKEKQLAERREQLRDLLAHEKSLYDLELRERAKPKSRRVAASTESLEKIDQNVKERENIKRKLELEAKLYGKWRHGVDDQNLIFESKSDNEVLAKLNWLDKQIEDQLQREREEAISQERNLRMQEEISKTEQTQKERQQIREHELTEIRALQERHMAELKERQTESDQLKEGEKKCRTILEQLEKELELLDESTAVTLEPAEMSQAYNLKKIKVFIRKRSEVFRNQIQLSLNILKRVASYASKEDVLNTLMTKYQDQLAAETHTLGQIEAMYESEAKYNLQRCEEVWQTQHMDRYRELLAFLKAEQCTLTTQLHDNVQRQNYIIEVRSTHLASIENSNEKLKQLIKEQNESPRGNCDSRTIIAAPASMKPTKLNCSPSLPSLGQTLQSSLPKLTNSFTNLNLDVWQDLPSARGGIDSPRLHSQRAMQVITPDTSERPKFGRKRVAWN